MSATTPEALATLVCSICLRGFDSSLGYLRCNKCKITIELPCGNALLGAKKFAADWRCPKCLVQPDADALCEICCYSGGFLLQLRDTKPLEESKHWIHPFCGYFHNEFTKSKDEASFFNDSTKEKGREKVERKRKEKQKKEMAKLLSCHYCQRDCGYRKECGRCHNTLMHAICAYKENRAQQLTNEEILCSECIAKGEAREKARRKSARINTKTKKSCEEHEELKEEISNDKKHNKKHNMTLMEDKVKCNYHPRTINMLKGLIYFIEQADQFKVFRKEYITLPIDLTLEDFKVTSIMIFRTLDLA